MRLEINDLIEGIINLKYIRYYIKFIFTQRFLW